MSTIYIDGAVWQVEGKVVEYVKQLRAEIKALLERIDLAVDYLPECPDEAKSFLVPALESDIEL